MSLAMITEESGIPVAPGQGFTLGLHSLSRCPFHRQEMGLRFAEYQQVHAEWPGRAPVHQAQAGCAPRHLGAGLAQVPRGGL